MMKLDDKLKAEAEALEAAKATHDKNLTVRFNIMFNL